MEKKNFSLYMPEDFYQKLDQIAEINKALAPLSKSQMAYFIISQIADHNLNLDSFIAENSIQNN